MGATPDSHSAGWRDPAHLTISGRMDFPADVSYDTNCARRPARLGWADGRQCVLVCGYAVRCVHVHDVCKGLLRRQCVNIALKPMVTGG